MGWPGSLMSCPGPETAASAAMGDSGYHKTLHIFHPLLHFYFQKNLIFQYFLVFHQPREKSSNTDQHLLGIWVHLKSLFLPLYTGRINRSNIPNVFYWHGPSILYKRDRIHFYILWPEQASCFFSWANSIFWVNEFWVLKCIT